MRTLERTSKFLLGRLEDTKIPELHDPRELPHLAVVRFWEFCGLEVRKISPQPSANVGIKGLQFETPKGPISSCVDLEPPICFDTSLPESSRYIHIGLQAPKHPSS